MRLHRNPRSHGLFAATASVEAGTFGIGLVGQDQVPSVEAVFAAIGDEISRQPNTVLTWMRQQVATTSTIHTDDRGFRF